MGNLAVGGDGGGGGGQSPQFSEHTRGREAGATQWPAQEGGRGRDTSEEWSEKQEAPGKEERL